ncbi:hypothetical protein HPB51_018181 [Rhipicephalus microplus]|uniref:Tick transposon n=1 Tax=Rhipicephalus microplus TaxID=6941 RepID=A0A9J6D6R8_RHIMP|nr:hypothetical protein HPB51_018181 [Rhipicephalus microplus]
MLRNRLKFCEHPNLDKEELLSLVRSTVGREKDDEIGRLVQEGVECLPQNVKKAQQRSSAVVASLRRADVKLLQSDKEGRFVLTPKNLYDSKTEEAMRKNFNVLPATKETMKTHKEDNPIRVIVSERGTWQHPAALYLRRSLAVLPIDEPCQIKSPVTISDYLRTECPKRHSGYSPLILHFCGSPVRDIETIPALPRVYPVEISMFPKNSTTSNPEMPWRSSDSLEDMASRRASASVYRRGGPEATPDAKKALLLNALEVEGLEAHYKAADEQTLHEGV